MSEFALLLRIASRNIFSSFLNVIIGLIILAGTLFFVVGGSLVSSMDSAMSRSIIGSVAGNAQIYAADSKDAPAIFDNWNLPDMEAIPDFAKVKGPLLEDPNIKAIVPMGISTAIVAYGNTVDQALEKLRNGLTHKPLAPRAEIVSLKSHVRQIITIIQGDYAKLSVVADKKSIDAQASADLQKAASDAFWGSFDADPLNHLEFLENRIASLVPDADQIFLSYVGTDLDAYQKAFDRMEVVDGTAVPKGRRGMLLSKYIYETQFKLKIAHRLDQIQEALTEKGKKIAQDPDLQDLVKQNKTQTREIILQLDPLSLQKAVAAMQAATGSREADVAKLLPIFLDTNDDNFEARYKAFYDHIAPLIELYRLKPGELLTIKAYTKSGFVEAVNVKVYGTFQFKGLEKSGLAGALSLMDLMSFRDLYGYITPEKIAETKALQKAAGAREVSRDNAEAELFGGSTVSVVGNATQVKIDDQAQLGDAREAIKSADLINRVYSQGEIEKGVAIQAAVILKDPSQLKATMGRIQDISDKNKLGLKVVDWQKAAGNIGQFVLVVKLVLFIATAIIFVVALVIINNAVVMATLQRVREIGTLRAIGAQKGFVLAMVLTETMALGMAFGAVGALLGSAFVAWLGHAGIPAGNEFLYFFFSGPRLFPGLSGGSLVGAFVVVLIVTCASALYPAIMATRVSPIQAMASED
jgi:ABC-type lipoprotein release transport system permease subunit